MYLAVALLVTALLCFVTAPFGAPDEENQSLRAIQLAHGGWIAERGLDEAGGYLDSGAIRTLDAFDTIRIRWEKTGTDFHDRPWGTMTEAQLQPLLQRRWSGQMLWAGFGNTAPYPPFLYLPAMAGWRLGEALDLTVVGSLRLARLLCALAAVVTGWLALQVMVAGRVLLFALLLLPSTLFLNASCSQDALLLSVTALAAALLARALTEERLLQTGELVITTGLLGLAALARPPYLLLSVLLLLPCLERRAAARQWLAPALAAGSVLALCIGWRHLVAPLGIDIADEAAPARQAAFLRGHLWLAALAIARGTGTAAADLLRRGLYVLGWNDLLAPWWLRVADGATLLAAILCSLRAPTANVRRWCVVLLTTGSTLAAVSLAEYIIWTPPGLATVYGVQPRYWLPVLPFPVMLAGRGKLRAEWLVAFTAALAVILALTVPPIAAEMFFRESLWRVLRISLS